MLKFNGIEIDELKRYMFTGCPLCLHVDAQENQCGMPATIDARSYDLADTYQRCEAHRL